jgi:hypothetical protein
MPQVLKNIYLQKYPCHRLLAKCIFKVKIAALGPLEWVTERVFLQLRKLRNGK